MPSIAKESPKTQGQSHSRVAALRVEIATVYATIYRGKYTKS
jgi:hypothetical protein